MIEVEQRGLLDQQQYADLRRKLQDSAEFLGEDNKYVEYYIYSDRLLKLVRNDSKNNSVLSLKFNAIGEGVSYDECELSFDHKDFQKLERIVSNIAKPDQIIKGTQKRENYKLDEVEVAIKWSEDWGYHFELECTVDNKAYQNEAELKLNKVAQFLEITFMTVEQERDFIAKVRANKKN